MALRFTIKASLEPTKRKLALLHSQQQKDLKTEVDIFNLNVLRDSKTKPPRVPLHTGALQSTGFTEDAEVKGNKVTGSVGYGGIALDGTVVDYAIYVHEAAQGQYSSLKTRQVRNAPTFKRPGAGPKFVETHWNNRRSTFKQTGEVTLGKSWKKL